jgi:indole-3-glycerol phosphate synthase
MTILNEILQSKKEELGQTKGNVTLSDLKARIRDMEPALPLRPSIDRRAGSPIKLIAELKKASPSKGLIREDFNVPEIVSVYNSKEVAAISVLTEERYFQGKLSYLGEARKRTTKPLLRKDFIFDDYQIFEARANGADALLLIVAALERSRLSDLYGRARELGLDCLVEVHSSRELDTALYCGADIIGINNRNLMTLDISLNMTFALLKDIPRNKTVVSESGINTRADVESIEATATDAILVGTTLMKSPDIGKKIDELMGKG